MTVLIVEDEMLLALDYQGILRGVGCTVLGPVPRESAALELVERTLPDAVLLDLDLGGTRPVALAETLVRRGVPFLIVSGYSRQQAHEPVFRNAPRLDKPASGSRLIDALAVLLAQGGPAQPRHLSNPCFSPPRAVPKIP